MIKNQKKINYKKQRLYSNIKKHFKIKNLLSQKCNNHKYKNRLRLKQILDYLEILKL